MDIRTASRTGRLGLNDGLQYSEHIRFKLVTTIHNSRPNLSKTWIQSHCHYFTKNSNNTFNFTLSPSTANSIFALCHGYMRNKIISKYFNLHRHPPEIILFQGVETCLKLFQNYFAGILQFMNIFQHVHCRWKNLWNNFRTPSAAEIILFQFQTWLHVK